MGQSKDYVCPNTLALIAVDYDEQTIIVNSPDEYYDISFPIGLLIRVLEREPQLRDHIMKELHEGVAQASE